MLQWTLGYMCIFKLWLSLNICPGVGLLGHMVIQFLVFRGACVLFSVVAVPVYIPVNSAGEFPLLLTLSRVVCWIFDEGFSDRCEVIPHCGFDLHFSDKWVMLSFFSCAFWSSLCLLWRNLCFDLLCIFLIGFVFFILSRMSCRYTLQINLLSVTLFANIFSRPRSVGRLFVLLLPWLFKSF